MVQLQNVAEIFNGKTPSKDEQRSSGFPVLKIKDVSEDGFFRGEITSYVDEEMAHRFEKKIVRNEDVLLLNAAHNSDYVGSKNCIATKEMSGVLATGEWTIIRPNKEKVIPQFLYFFINSPITKQEIRNIVKGIHLYPKDLKNIDFPLPPLKDQKRIVSILDQADALRRKRKEAIGLLDEYVQSVFLEMFGDPVANPKGIEQKEVMKMGRVVTGNTPPRANQNNYGNFIEWIKSDNINNDFCIATKAEEWLSEEGAKSARIAPANSILVTCIAGSKSCIGNCGIIDRDASFNQQINAIIPHEDVDPYFLYIQVKLAKELFQKAATSGMKGLLSKSRFSKVKLLHPDIEEQKKMSDKFTKCEAAKQKMIQQQIEIDNQFNSLIQRAFAGAL